MAAAESRELGGGSGLSKASLISPQAFGQVLRFPSICYNPRGVDHAKPAHYLDIYAPPDAGFNAGDRKYPTVFFFHGGGWRRGHIYSRLGFFQNVGAALARQGYVAVLPSYSKSLYFPPWMCGILATGILASVASLLRQYCWPGARERSSARQWLAYLVSTFSIRQLLRLSGWGARHPDHTLDCAMAVAWAASGGVCKFGGDPNQLVLTGQSAGAHIASLLALPQTDYLERSLKKKQLKGLIAISGIYSGTLFRAHVFARLIYSYVFEGNIEWDKCFALGHCRQQDTSSALARPLTGMCPVLLINASMDVGLVPHAEEFAKVLRESDVVVEGPCVLPNTDHFTMMLRVGRAAPNTSDQLLLTTIKKFLLSVCA